MREIEYKPNHNQNTPHDDTVYTLYYVKERLHLPARPLQNSNLVNREWVMADRCVVEAFRFYCTFKYSLLRVRCTSLNVSLSFGHYTIFTVYHRNVYFLRIRTSLSAIRGEGSYRIYCHAGCLRNIKLLTTYEFGV